MSNPTLESEIKKYTEQLAADPKSRSFVALSDTYRRMGRYEEAILVAKEGLLHHPTYVAGKTALARVYFENGDADLARSLLEEVLHVAPDNILVNRLLAQLYLQQKENEKAVTILRQLVLLDPGDSHSIAQLKQLEGTPEVQTQPPQSVETSTLAELYRSQGHFEKALEIYRKLATAHPERAEFARAVSEIEIALKPKQSVKPNVLETLLERIRERRRAA